jgi:hypothetical protein
MKNPANLSHDQLVYIATGMMQLLYGVEHADSSWTYAADKEWRGSDVCEAAAGLLGQFGLVPAADGVGEPMEPAAAPDETRRSGDLRQRYSSDETASKKLREPSHAEP